MEYKDNNHQEIFFVLFLFQFPPFRSFIHFLLPFVSLPILDSFRFVGDSFKCSILRSNFLEFFINLKRVLIDYKLYGSQIRAYFSLLIYQDHYLNLIC